MSKSKLSLRIFANQIAKIMMQEPDGKTTTYCPCDGVKAKVEIVLKTLSGKPYEFRDCDQVRINDACVGNRYGAIQEFTNMVIEANPEVLLMEKEN